MVLGHAQVVVQCAMDLDGEPGLADREFRIAAGGTNLRTTGDSLGAQARVVRLRRLAHGVVGRTQRLGELPLIAVGDPKVVMRLGNAPIVPGPLERANGGGVGPDGPAVLALHARDDAEIVGRPADRGEIALEHRFFLRTREVVDRLADASALQRDGTADVEGPHLDRAVPEHAGAHERAESPGGRRVHLPQPRMTDRLEKE